MNDVAPVRLSKQASVSAHSLKMAFVAGGDGRERVVCDEYRRHYGDVPTEQADVIVLVGGNTAVIEAMHRFANLPDRVSVRFDALQPNLSSTSATADFIEIRDVAQAVVHLRDDDRAQLLLDPDHSIDERLMCEQFKGLPVQCQVPTGRTQTLRYRR